MRGLTAQMLSFANDVANHYRTMRPMHQQQQSTTSSHGASVALPEHVYDVCMTYSKDVRGPYEQLQLIRQAYEYKNSFVLVLWGLIAPQLEQAR